MLRNVLDGFRSQERDEVFVLEKPLHRGRKDHQSMSDCIQACHRGSLTLDMLLILLD